VEDDRARRAPLYARACVPETWLLNVRKGELEVYREPGPAGYGRTYTLRPEQQVACGASPEVVLRVAGLLPPLGLGRRPERARPRERVPHQLRRGRGEHRLPPVGGGRQPGAAVKGGPGVVGPLALRLARVQPHPGPEGPRPQRPPVGRQQRARPGQGGGDRVGGAGEGGVDRVPHRLGHHAPVGRHRPPDQRGTGPTWAA
jgi:hypothetical protein